MASILLIVFSVFLSIYPKGKVAIYYYSSVAKAMQTTLLVSRQHIDVNGCGREVIIHYSLYPD